MSLRPSVGGGRTTFVAAGSKVQHEIGVRGHEEVPAGGHEKSPLMASGKRYELVRAGRKLLTYADKLDAFVCGCRRAVEVEDFRALELVSSDLTDAATLLQDVAADLPSDIGCPEDVPDLPATCGPVIAPSGGYGGWCRRNVPGSSWW